MSVEWPQPDRRCGCRTVRCVRGSACARSLPAVGESGGGGLRAGGARWRAAAARLSAGDSQSRGGARGGGRARLSHPVLGRRCAGGWREREPQRQRPLAPGGGGGGGSGGRGALGGQGGGHGGRHAGRRARKRARHHQRRAPQETPRHHQLLRGQCIFFHLTLRPKLSEQQNKSKISFSFLLNFVFQKFEFRSQE
jgi:hypothetical protein